MNIIFYYHLYINCIHFNSIIFHLLPAIASGQKLSCSWERHPDTRLIGKEIGTSSKREHAKSKCKAQQEKCSGIEETDKNMFRVNLLFVTVTAS